MLRADHGEHRQSSLWSRGRHTPDNSDIAILIGGAPGSKGRLYLLGGRSWSTGNISKTLNEKYKIWFFGFLCVHLVYAWLPSCQAFPNGLSSRYQGSEGSILGPSRAF